MAAVMPDLRTPVMILVDVTWEDENGVRQTGRACVEDKSAGGACIRAKAAIAPGSKLKVKWRFEQFSGLVKYCRREGREYLVGIQRDSVQRDGGTAQTSGRVKAGIEASRPIVSDIAAQNISPGSSSVASANTSGSLAERVWLPRGELAQTETLETPPKSERKPPPEAASPAAVRSLRETRDDSVRHALHTRDRPVMRRKKFAVPRQTELRSEQDPDRREADRERKFMPHKWLDRAPWNHKQETPAGSGDENASGDENKNATRAKENPMSQSSQLQERVPTTSAREVPAFQVELLPMEDIYRTAGIVSPRKGYSVTKVVEMLNSEHIRALSKETKRAALLMALDAAGVTIEQVQRDAKARQSALEAYESEQKKQVDAEWGRKAEEISHIQSELESIKAHYTSRISRNMEALARDKARFNNWVTTKEQESQSMSEAVDLCLKSPVSEPVSAPPPREINVPVSSAAAASAGGMKS